MALALVPSSPASAPSSFGADVAALLPELRIRALRLTRNDTLADDVVQDTVERALKFQDHYQHGTNLRAWLSQVLFSVFITRCRRSTRERKALERISSDPDGWTQPVALPSPETSLSLTKRTEATLAKVPESFRSVMVLVDLEDRSYRDAAVTLGVPLGTVMSRLHRGRKMLAEMMPSEAA